MTATTIDILGVTSAMYVETTGARGIRSAVALDEYRRTFRAGHAPDGVDLGPVRPVRADDDDGTVKFLLRHADGLETESVIIPGRGSAGRDRRTLCVSSQVGCAMGCGFCETAQMGLMKNLTPAEIVGQWFAARFALDAVIDNIVFMGMGEPLDNVDAVLAAIRVLTDRNGPAIAPSRITVSTVGRDAGIRRLGAALREDRLGRVQLAVSVNAPNDDIRASIMPINRATPMAALMNAMLDWAADRRARVLVEYVCIPGVNDADAHADELCRYLRPLDCTVNVIPYNPRRDSPWPAPDDADVARFVDRIAGHGQAVRRRRTHGRAAMAACGQLGNPAIRRRRFVALGTDGDPG
ncbi:MAG: 23S rRNA (adenine(2503)-C(2))-methyltransferase RlmN [Phycisphaerales bacterium]|nr:23S rRNA (adenine(2503)-C(2))-methyltransferase RlmN [Phycisphaerales bacterium]